MKNGYKKALRNAVAVGTALVIGGSTVSADGLISGLTVVSEAASTVAGGTAGNKTTYTLTDDGVLRISLTSGSSAGQIAMYNTSNAPWYNNRSKITSIVVDSGVTAIGACAFADCTNLKSVSLPEGITYIHDRAFMNCGALTKITVPSTVDSIGQECFLNCTALSSANIPLAVTEIRDDAFLNTAIVNNTSGIAYIDNWVVGANPDITSANIKSGTVGIACRAFANFEDLAEASIPDSVKYVGRLTFWNTPVLNNQTDLVHYVGSWVVGSDRDIVNATVKEGTTGIAHSAFNIRNSLKTVSIPSSVKIIEKNAFNAPLLESVSLPGVETIRANTFYQCSSLKSVTVGSGTKVIRQHAFSECSSLSSVKLPTTVEAIDQMAFNACTALKTVTVPSGTKTLANYVFYGCTALETVYLPKSLTSIGYKPFYGCTALKNVYYAGSQSDWNNLDKYIAAGPAYAAIEDGVTLTCDYISEEEASSPVPKNLKATAGAESVTLSWNAVNNATRYRVQVNDGSGWKTAVYPTTNSCTVKGLASGKVHSFRVLAYVNGKWNDPSDVVTATPLKGTTPQNVKAVAGAEAVTVTWDKVDGASRYRVQVNDGSGWKSKTYPTTNSSKITGLITGKTYSFRVVAYANGKWNGASAVVTAVPKAGATPQNVKAVSGQGSVTVSWDKVNAAVKYRVQINDGSGWKTSGYPVATSYTVNNLTEGKTYSFRVLAYADGTWNTASAVVTAVPKKSYTPANVTVYSGQNMAMVLWDKVDGAVKYRVQANDGSGWKTLSYPTDNTVTIKNLNSGLYNFRVLAYVNGSWSAASSPIKVYIN